MTLQILSKSSFLFLLCILCTSCVKKKIFLAEERTRMNCEVREAVLLRQLGDRKKEAIAHVDTIGSLNREIGQKEKQISDLLADTEIKTQQFGASEQQLRTELASTQMKLKVTQVSLAEKNRVLSSIEERKLQLKGRSIQLNNALSETMLPWLNQGVDCGIVGEEVRLTIPNAILFAGSNIDLGPGGRTLLMGLSRYINEHPEVKIEIHAHTHYDYPRAIKDSWQWAGLRARAVAQSLVLDCNVNGNQLTPVIKGEFFPVASNQTAEGRAQNLRTELFFGY